MSSLIPLYRLKYTRCLLAYTVITSCTSRQTFLYRWSPIIIVLITHSTERPFLNLAELVGEFTEMLYITELANHSKVIKETVTALI